MNKETGTSFNGAISFTADGVAYRRTFTNIPYSMEIFRFLESVGGMMDPKEKERADAMPGLIPMFEARYLLTDRLLKQRTAMQILELASGLSPRGYNWSTDLGCIAYVEMDLPEKMVTKRKVVEELHHINKSKDNGSLSLLNGDVTSCLDVANSASHFFLHEPVHVVCEGLLRYLSLEDRQYLAAAVHEVIYHCEDSGGAWITPDIELLSEVNATPESRARYDRMAVEWGFDVRPNLFKDIDHAVSFFEGFGFSVEIHSQLEVIDELVSPKRLGLSDEAVHQQLRGRRSFLLTV